MNNIKEIDILDKSKLALTDLFKDNISLNEQQVRSSKEYGIDGIIKINASEFNFVVLSRPNIGTIIKTIKTKINLDNQPRNPIFIVDFANKELVNFFRKENLFFVDTVGNCFINLPSLNVFVEGRKSTVKEPLIKRAFQKTGLKLIYQLFINPELASETYREIANKTKISLASIGYIFDELLEDGYLIAVNNQKKQLSNIKRLITKWAMSYGENLRPKIHRGYFSSLDKKYTINQINSSSIAGKLAISGEFGAHSLYGSIKPERLVIYTNERLSKLAEKYEIIPVRTSSKQDNQIEVLEKFWMDDSVMIKLNVDELSTSNHQIVAPILIYADLMLSNNYRSIETAENLLNNEIRNQFLQYNFQW